MAVPVNVFVTAESVPVQGVEVHLFDPALSMLFVASAMTDAAGKAAFLVPGAATPGKQYEVRFFKIGYVFPNPRLIEVLEPASPTISNDYDVLGEVVGDFGIPANPRLCRCVGRMLNYSQQPVRNGLVRVTANVHLPKKTPKIVDGMLVATEVMETRTDNEGYFFFDLIRTGEYFVTFAGETDQLWNIKVPDLSSFNIVELMHPQPLVMSWGMTGNLLVVGVGATVELPLTLLFSDNIIRTELLPAWVEFMNSDPDVIDVLFVNGNTLRITGRVPGSAVVTPNVIPGLLPARIPDYNLGPTEPLQVTVAP